MNCRPFFVFVSFFIGITLSLTACSGGGITAYIQGGDQPDQGAMIFKIYVQDSGMIEFPIDDLHDYAGVTDLFETGEYRLFFNGHRVTSWIEKFDSELIFRFYAMQSSSAYTAENIYWLVVCDRESDCPDPPQPAKFQVDILERIRASGSLASTEPEHPVDTYFSTINLEENLVYKPQVEGEEHWFWSSMTAPSDQRYIFNLTNPAIGRGSFRISGWTSTESDVDPDHRLVIHLNNHLVLDKTWFGKGIFNFTSKIPQGILVDGENWVEIKAPGVTGVPAEIYLLDSFEIGYPSYFHAVQNRLTFVSKGNEHRLEGFTGIVNIYDLTDPLKAVWVGVLDQESNKFKGVSGHRYYVVGSNGYLSPTRVQPAVLTPDLRNPSNAADYLVIGPSLLLGPVDNLLALRSEQGLKSVSVSLEAIYDQFGAGFPEPETIRAFLQYTQTNWQRAPMFLLLVGDATYDPKGYISLPDANQLPVFLVDTIFGGQTASDVGYSQLSGDVWQSSEGKNQYEIAVGRIPARNVDQVELMVKKIIGYESSNGSSQGMSGLQDGVLAIADGQEASFKADAQNFLDLFPDQFRKSIIAPRPGDGSVNQEISAQIGADNLLVAYFGHGSVNMWGKDRLFSAEDVEKMPSDSQLPVILNLTCLTGLFTHPSIESLAEALLWKEDGGAVAVLAPTSLTLPSDQSFLVDALVNTFVTDSTMAIGEILRQARQQIPLDRQGLRDVSQTFILFGDPALRLKVSSP